VQRDQDQGLAGEIAEIIKHWNLPFFIEPSHTTGQTAIILNIIKESWWPQPLSKYKLVNKAIIWHTNATTAKFEPISNCQYHLSSSICNWQNVYLQGIDIFQKPFWKI
jgi:hypothetical protein